MWRRLRHRADMGMIAAVCEWVLVLARAIDLGLARVDRRRRHK